VVNVSHAVTNQWTTGYEAAMTVRNDTGSTLTAWRLVGSQMGTAAIQAATSTRDQLRGLYPTRTDTQLWAMVGVTPMIGQNDIQGEVFTTADARQLTEFARQNHLGRLAMWSVNRDSQCPAGVKTSVDNLCSGVTQTPNEFSITFKRHTG